MSFNEIYEMNNSSINNSNVSSLHNLSNDDIIMNVSNHQINKINNKISDNNDNNIINNDIFFTLIWRLTTLF